MSGSICQVRWNSLLLKTAKTAHTGCVLLKLCVTSTEVSTQKDTPCDSEAAPQIYSSESQYAMSTAVTSPSCQPTSNAMDHAKPARTRKSSLPLDLFNIQGYLQMDSKPSFNRSISCHSQPMGGRYAPSIQHSQPMGEHFAPGIQLLAEEILTPANIARVKTQAIQRKISQTEAPDLQMLEHYDPEEYEDLYNWRKHSLSTGQVATYSY